MSTDKRICLTTCSSDDEAESLARALVERRLVACVNVVPGVRSFYRWKGAVEVEEERLLVMKTTAAGVAALRAALLELHSYETPEFVVLVIDEGLPDYLNWVGENVGAGREDSTNGV